MKPLAVMTLGTAQPGWRHEGMEALWSLSVHRLRRLVDAGHFAGLLLIADRGGAAWADWLGLPFTDVVRWLDDFPVDLTVAWSAVKLVAWQRVGRPFVHFDGDVLLRSPLPAHALAAQVLVEQAVKWDPRKGSTDVLEWTLPNHWMGELRGGNALSWGCGIVGGQAWHLLRDAAEMCLAVLRANLGRIGGTGLNTTGASMLVEQWGLAREVDPWAVCALLPGGLAEEASRQGRHCAHLGGGMKLSQIWRDKVAAALRSEWPDQAARLEPDARLMI